MELNTTLTRDEASLLHLLVINTQQDFLDMCRRKGFQSTDCNHYVAKLDSIGHKLIEQSL